MSRFKIQRRDERRRARKRTIAAFAVLAFLVLPFLGGAGWVYFQVHASGSAGKQVTVDIPQGSGVSTIGDILEKNHIIRSGFAFAVYTKINRRGPYDAGQYEMPTNIDASRAADILVKGPKINYQDFTIIPGQRLIDVRNNVDKLPTMTGKAFDDVLASNEYRSKFEPDGTNNLEGLMLPETYSISGAESEASIVQRAVQEFDARAQNNGLSGEFKGLTPYQVIIVASLIEKEARYSGDRKLISSVIYNRLAHDMPLQIDATLLYGLGRASGSLSNTDLQKDTPYNTYLHKGLPPTPISMISMASLQAALNPADTTYLYYVLTDAKTGKHAFANTYEEHQANIVDSKARGQL